MKAFFVSIGLSSIGLSVTISMFFTLLRLVVSPVLIPLLLSSFFSSPSRLVHGLLGGIFFIFGFTDFLDGYCARLFNQVTQFGAFLDPLADKFLFLSTIISLVSVGAVSAATAIFLLARELYVMGLRELGLLYGISLPVIWSAKIKTAFQMLYLGWVIIQPQLFFGQSPAVDVVHKLLLGCMLGASFYSAYVYSLQMYQGIFA